MWCVVNATPWPLYPLGKRPSTHCIGGSVGPDGRSGRVRKISPPTGFDTRTVHPSSNRYTDYARILSVLHILCPVKKDFHSRYLQTLTKNSRRSDRGGPRTLLLGGGVRIRDTYIHMHRILWLLCTLKVHYKNKQLMITCWILNCRWENVLK